jgi:predicted transcriptional regulator
MKRLRIRPDKEGTRVTLFDLEADIMDVVWSNEWQEFDVGDVHGVLERTRSIAYTTVMTTVARLFEKGLLERERDGRRYVYRPAMNRDEFMRAMAREVLGSLPAVGREEAVALLVERVAEADASELDRLEALIRARRDELKK